MNLSRTLDVALPELPPQTFRETYPRFHPEIFYKVHEEPKGKVIMALTPGARRIVYFTPEQWALLRMFDGRRSYEWLSRWWRKECNAAATPEQIRKYAESLDEYGFWYRTPQEESAALMENLRQGREIKKKRTFGDVSKMEVFSVDIDKQLGRVYQALRWVYDPRFVAFTFVAMAWMLAVWILRSGEVIRDSVAYWNMADKGLRDVLEFYLTFAIVGFFHEAGHALTAKHFGAGVHRVGLLLVYTTPGFFVDTGEVWIHHSRRERCLTLLAGFWYELTTCAFATLIWWGTPAASTAHDLAYKYILVGGIMPVVLNCNPLMRLDGYLTMCEFFRVPNLKQRSTAFLSAWVRKNIFGMAANVPVMPRRRAILWGTYAFVSGLYGYVVLLFLSRLTYRIFLRITPEWAFVPATLVALRIFRSRIETLMSFLKALYLDKKELLLAHRRRIAMAGALVVVALFIPVRRERIQVPFVLEPMQRAVIRAEVPGRVESVMVREGEVVEAAAPVAKLRNVNVESEAANTNAQLQFADARLREAMVRNADYAAARDERQQWAERARLVRDQQTRLSVSSPITGVVVTPRVEDLRGAWVTEGTTIAEIQDLSNMRARAFVPEGDMRTVHHINGQALHVSGLLRDVRGYFAEVSPTPMEIDPTLITTSKYKGLKPPPEYVAMFVVPNKNGELKSGMVGEVKIYGVRRSLIGTIWRPLADFAQRKFW